MTSPHLLHRIGAANLTVRSADGMPLPNTPVTVEQVGHSFGFGNIGFDLISHANGERHAPPHLFGGATSVSGERLAELWCGLFNHATLPFYWSGFEPRRGEPDTERILAAAQWFTDRGVTVKGHPLLWHTLAPTWLLELSDDEVAHVIRQRITREVRDFAGTIDLWDAINEAVILPVFNKQPNAVTRLAQTRGRVEVVLMAFETARAANPNARLVLNDFDLSEDYEHLIEDCLAADIDIDAIGVQTHMHQGFRGEEQIAHILDRFGRFGLPIQMTETTLVSGDLMPADIVDLNDYQVPSWPSTPEGEERQAEEIVRHYRTVLAHPAVESLTYWGLTDDGAWLGAPAGLVRDDGSTKPAYDALESLLRDEWWVRPTELATDAQGHVNLEGFGGHYRVTCRDTALDITITAGDRDTEMVMDLT